jgi:hypothetical protein
MLCGMRLVLLVGIAFATSAGATPRAGKVVRVERRAHGASGIPRYCEVRDDGQGPVGVCYGNPPPVGALIELVDDTHVFAQVKISETTIYQSCKWIWTIKGALLRGDLAAAQSGRSIGLVDAGLDPRTAHRISDDLTRPSPTGRAEEHVFAAIDRDGRGNDDIVITQYVCDPQGQPNAMGIAQCMDVYNRIGGRLVRAQQTIIAGCF